ncbi:pyrroloquinoline quinone biosynthesis protein PqqE [Aureimonas phyllosphaerae]|uniref:PqqA peptide cyclase n=1 Tax=Aureimonas phyllosphaerae TaxID=1166078 RepID=A0A7W6BYR8_9HYPH|nr:pyrroloquinoline quinone biosynthesis protein PqqE [Aureimonas phyllosphaerae]MBB3937618.1 pyrroloquinoline quinone biosynthesis protein E [Aureimonas phyllosphaerae]MBB3961582.1 pyrroloquinoline quinone biosynthesis protein E [Aureimonas phyllosphaerae]SFF46864.1 pyrroloquinoline quinone biosynthesis protein E [Aureimonas phyllosphaerae]
MSLAGPGLPIGILAELTHRCTLQCAYCSNPLELLKADRELGTDDWVSIFRQAADLGILQVHLSGGEPTLRRDLPTLIETLAARGVYTNLITAGVGVDAPLVETLRAAGLDHVQISFQGARPETTELIGRLKGAHERKLAAARAVRDAGLPLTVNAPIHRHNIDEVELFIELALELGAERLEIANVQYYGWALLNRATLMPSRAALERQIAVVEAARERLRGVLAIDFVAPDYYARYPKACMGGWARDAFMITPDGTAMPCHGAASIPHLVFDNAARVPLADIWARSPAFEAYRGTAWMKEPCRSCDRREIDFGGCRCQAMMLAGDAAATDPACSLSPLNDRINAIARDEAQGEAPPFRYRRIGAAREPA